LCFQGIAYHHIIQKMMMVYVSESKSFLTAKKGSAIYSIAVLPIGKVAHSSDVFNLIAMGTPSKLLVLAMKPQIEVCFKAVRPSEVSLTALPCTAWRPSASCIPFPYFLPFGT